MSSACGSGRLVAFGKHPRPAHLLLPREVTAEILEHRLKVVGGENVRHAASFTMSRRPRYASPTLAPSDGSPLGDIPDDELTSLVDDVLQSGKHATSPGPPPAPQGAKKSDERLHAKSQPAVAPPPPVSPAGSDEDRWFFEVRGKQLGPVTLGEAGKLWTDGKLDSTAYCWNAKFSAWIPLAKVTALARALTPAQEPKAPITPAAAVLATAALTAPAAAAASPVVSPVASPVAGPAVGGAASGENASAASTGSPDHVPSVPQGAAPAEVVTFVRPSPRVVVESVVAGSFDDEVMTPRQRMPSWFKQSLLTGLVAGGIMAAIVVGAQRTTSLGQDGAPGTAEAAVKAVSSSPATGTALTAAPGTPASTASAPASVAAPPALATGAAASAPTTAELQTHQAPAAPAVAATGSRPASALASETPRTTATSASQEPAAPRVAVRPPTWTTPPARTPAPPITASAPRSRTTGTPNPNAQEETGPHDEFGPTVFAREFKETPPDPPKRTVYIPPAPGVGALPEQLTTEELEAVAESHQSEVVRCIDAHRPLGGPGEITMRWTLSTDGTVSGARAITGGLQDGALATCLAGAISTWKFPAHRQQMEPVELPFPY